MAAALLAPAAAQAQTATVFTRPWLDWRTLRTEHFEVHYPAEAAAWTVDLASRLEGAYARVDSLVGQLPTGRIRVVVEDPAGTSNGAAYAFLDRPLVALWPTPPDPRSNLGETRGAAEQLVLHEIAHIAHLGRPSRNPLERAVTRLLPVRTGPIDRMAPRWATEGFATWAEGRLTGSGRPYGSHRAALLRQWALEGRLPPYRTLDDAAGYYGSAMAYMAGSAFLEWLAGREGPESVDELWDEMSGTRRTSFDDAFEQVYGAYPSVLYQRFTAELTGSAVEVRQRLRDAGGVVAGDTVQRLTWGTGDPAISPDGRRMAMVVRGAPGTPSRVVVWGTDEAPPALALGSGRVRRGGRRGSGGMPAVSELLPVEGRAHDAPRFLPDGRLLLVRSEPIGGGATRGDLFIWNPADDALQRVTRGAGIRAADPAPDGRSAAAVRCSGGVCDLVRVTLPGGEMEVMVPGVPDVVYHRPRWSADGSRLLLSVLHGGSWRAATLVPGSPGLTLLGPDDGADRYDAAWLPGETHIVVTSDRGGIANLEVLEVATGAVRPITRVLGAAVGAEVDPRSGEVFFLSLHSGGLDLLRTHPDSVQAALVELPAELAPAVPPPAAAPVDTLPRTVLAAPGAYGLGPRITRVLPYAAAGAQGTAAGWSLVNTDPIGRMTLLLRGGVGTGEVPRGASGSLEWRGWRRPLTVDGWWTERQGVTDWGAGLRTSAMGRTRGIRHGLGAGVYSGVSADQPRHLAWSEVTADGGRELGFAYLEGALRARGSTGATGGAGWSIGTLAGEVGLSSGWLQLRGEAAYSQLAGGETETLSVGGMTHPLIEPGVLPGRTAMPLFYEAALAGRRLTTWRVSSSVLGLRPYLWGAETEDASLMAVGVDWTLGLPRSNVLSLPGMQIEAGVGMPLTGPDAERPRVHVGIRYRVD